MFLALRVKLNMPSANTPHVEEVLREERKQEQATLQIKEGVGRCD